MAVPWRRREGRPCLDAQPWRPLRAVAEQSASGGELMVKSLFTEDGYHVMLTDLGRVWEESLEGDAIVARTKALNRSVDAPLSTVLEHLSTHLHNPPSPNTLHLVTNDDDHDTSREDSSPGEEGMTLVITAKLSSRLPFRWEFELVRADVSGEALLSHLVKPVLGMVSELWHRQEHLCKLLAQKDREIADYKDNGATVSRRHLETPVFNETAFLNQMLTSKEFQLASAEPLEGLSCQSSQELYRDIVLADRWNTHKGDVEDVPTGATVGTAGTWTGRIPTSLLPSLPPSSSSSSPPHKPHHTPPIVTGEGGGGGGGGGRSPTKRPAADGSPSKGDDELWRRHALERKLGEKTHERKKKKKLM